ncbi:MAG: hypothetical protein U0V02_10120 [Anaerolineales bacterium]
MKNKKWLTYTLGILLTLIVLAAVGGLGFRIGMMQSASFANLKAGQSAQAPFFHHGLGMNGQGMNDGFNRMDGFNHMEHGNMSNGFDRGRGGNRGGFFSPLFGLLHLIILGLLAWLGYKLIKNSGWKLVKVNASAAPAAEQASEVAASEEKKEEV